MDQNDTHYHAKPPGARDARHARAQPCTTKPTLCGADSRKRDADDPDPEGPSPFPGGLQRKVNPGSVCIKVEFGEKPREHFQQDATRLTFKI